MTELLPISLAIGISAVLGLFLTCFELRRSRKIACSNAETAIIGEFNEWTWKYNKNKDINTLLRVVNILEMLIKNVKRGLYPFNEYKCSFFPVTFDYIHELEKKYCREKEKTSDEFRKDFERFSELLIPVFELYEEKSNKFLKGKERTPDNLEGFRDSEYYKVGKSDFKKLKYKIKYPRLYAIWTRLLSSWLKLRKILSNLILMT